MLKDDPVKLIGTKRLYNNIVETGGNLTRVVTGTGKPITLTIDADESHLYWGDIDTGSIYKVTLR